VRRPLVPAAAALALLVAGCVSAVSQTMRPERRADPVPAGIGRIRHVIVIMQENRSFDSYFGTFPGADGIPTKDGRPAVCVPDPRSETCVPPYHDPRDRNSGGPHGAGNALADIDGGKMDTCSHPTTAGGCRRTSSRSPAGRPGARTHSTR
jgi:hypothetical protein